MAYEFYSAQTRQVKTAMVLSSATLFLYAVIGRPVSDEYIKIPPGQFEIPSAYLICLFFGSAIYFTASFFVSAKYDKRMAEIPELYKDISQLISGVENTQQDLLEAFVRIPSEIMKLDNKLFGEVSKINSSEIDTAIQTLNQPARNILTNLIDQIKTRESIDKLHTEYQEKLGHYEKITLSHLNGIRNSRKTIQGKAKGIAHFHNHRWEYQLPFYSCIGAILASLAHLVICFVK